ncbi:DUF427 domain-containing protein [Qipengyuania flava]|nr:DUF427 domain-containing protein [Qipengyuania flava]
MDEGQESVWNYPRPAIAEPSDRHLVIRHNGETLAETCKAWRTLETSHPPTYYLPPEDVATEFLSPNPHRSLCEWKGQARYWDVVLNDERIRAACWSYPDPATAFRPIAGYYAFYPSPFDECLVDGERTLPQPGGFYGGWITSREAGPFKGVPGSRYW